MYDPMTVAFEIKYPWWRTHTWTKTPYRYHASFITIWHVDPENPGRGNRTDDSCGWSRPPTTAEEREKIHKIGEEMFFDLFRQRDQIAKGDPEKYAYVCYEPTAYDAVYWAWRRIKREDTKDIWQYGKSGSGYLTPGELETIYHLSATPVDNVRVTVGSIKTAEDCGDFFMTVYNCYRRYNRPWWRHPRWHFWHWRLQIHPLQTLKRGWFDRCAGCGKRFGFGRTAVGEWSGDRIWHDECCPTPGPRVPDRAAEAVVAMPVAAESPSSPSMNETRH
jgi:hypothetical protein